jgi:hypothetical protein
LVKDCMAVDVSFDKPKDETDGPLHLQIGPRDVSG